MGAVKTASLCGFKADRYRDLTSPLPSRNVFFVAHSKAPNTKKVLNPEGGPAQVATNQNPAG
jgi:hypothetical protein